MWPREVVRQQAIDSVIRLGSACLVLWPRDRSPFDPLRAHPQTTSVPLQTLQAVSRAVTERENMTAGRLLFDHVHHRSAQSLEREAKIRYPLS
jgi:hypothetical protein